MAKINADTNSVFYFSFGRNLIKNTFLKQISKFFYATQLDTWKTMKTCRWIYILLKC